MDSGGLRWTAVDCGGLSLAVDCRVDCPPRWTTVDSEPHCGTTRDADTKDLLWCARVTRPVSGSKTFLRHTLSSTIDNSTKETLTLVSARVQMSAFSLPPPAIELTRRLRQGSGAVSAVVQEAARGEAVRAVGAHSSSPRPMVRLVGLSRGATRRAHTSRSCTRRGRTRPGRGRGRRRRPCREAPPPGGGGWLFSPVAAASQTRQWAAGG